jgi:hypothetical protein
MGQIAYAWNAIRVKGTCLVILTQYVFEKSGHDSATDGTDTVAARSTAGHHMLLAGPEDVHLEVYLRSKLGRRRPV